MVTWGEIIFGLSVRGIASSGMDGSDWRVIVQDLDVDALTVDQHGASLYWIQEARNEASTSRSGKLMEIMSSDLNGENVRRVVTMDKQNVLGLSVVGDWIYWWVTLDSTQVRIYKCNKENANGLDLNDIHIEQKNTGADPFLFVLPSHPEKHQGPCTGQLCSDICVPSTTGYFRCLCPAGFTLMSDGWTCGE